MVLDVTTTEEGRADLPGAGFDVGIPADETRLSATVSCVRALTFTAELAFGISDELPAIPGLVEVVSRDSEG